MSNYIPWIDINVITDPYNQGIIFYERRNSITRDLSVLRIYNI